MFKETTNSAPHPDHFGVGSTITAGQSGTWLVVKSTSSPQRISVLNLDTYAIASSTTEVADINHLTEEEYKTLLLLTGKHYTPSDFTPNPTKRVLT